MTTPHPSTAHAISAAADHAATTTTVANTDTVAAPVTEAATAPATLDTVRTVTATPLPAAGNLASRARAELITGCSVALLVLGAARWLSGLGARAAPPAAGGSVELAAALTPAVVVIAAPGDTPGAPISLQEFLTNVQWVIFGLLTTVTITFLFIGFTRWIAAHEADEYEKAKQSLKNAMRGFVGALLSPTIVSVLQSLVQGPRR